MQMGWLSVLVVGIGGRGSLGRREAERRLHSGRRPRAGRRRVLGRHARRDAEPRPDGRGGRPLHPLLFGRADLLAVALRPDHRASSRPAGGSRAISRPGPATGPAGRPTSSTRTPRRSRACSVTPATGRPTSASGTSAAVATWPTRRGSPPTATTNTPAPGRAPSPTPTSPRPTAIWSDKDKDEALGAQRLLRRQDARLPRPQQGPPLLREPLARRPAHPVGPGRRGGQGRLDGAEPEGGDGGSGPAGRAAPRGAEGARHRSEDIADLHQRQRPAADPRRATLRRPAREQAEPLRGGHPPAIPRRLARHDPGRARPTTPPSSGPSTCSRPSASSPARRCPRARPDGEDRSPALLGTPQPGRAKPLFWEYGRNDTSFDYPTVRNGARRGDRSPNLAVRDGRWKLLVNDDGTGAELYDVSADPAETKDLAAAEPGQVTRLTRLMLAWRKSWP